MKFNTTKMKKQLKIQLALTTSLILGLTNCCDLKQLNSYSSSSSTAIKKYEEINYSFKDHCLNNCYSKAINQYEIKKDSITDCDCDLYKQADEVTLLIYNSIKGYFDGLTNLSNRKLTTYNIDALKKSLTTGKFGDITIEAADVNAYSKLSILLNEASELFRKIKLKKYIETANPSLQILLAKLQYIFQENLEKELKWKKNDLFRYYKKMLVEKSLTDYEKLKATIEYYQQLSDINTKQNQIDVFAQSIKVIADGHQKLYDNRNKISAKDSKEFLIKYASDIQDIISIFNKLKK